MHDNFHRLRDGAAIASKKLLKLNSKVLAAFGCREFVSP